MDKYFAVFTLSCKHALTNYKALIGLSIFLITCLIIFAHLWKMAAAKTGAVHFQPDQLLWYIALNEWVLLALPGIQDTMEDDLRTGKLAYLLPRPISYLGTTFCEAMGALCINLVVLGIVAFVFTWLNTGTLPFPFYGIALTSLFALLAGCTGVIFQMLVGLSAFWLSEVDPFYWLWEKLLFIFGGLILPLTLYPQWMQILAQFTPFPAILGERSSLALNFSIENILWISASLIGWSVLGLLCLVFLYRRGLRILNVEGG